MPDRQSTVRAALPSGAFGASRLYPRPRWGVARRLLLLLLAVSILENSALAVVCAIHDMDLPTHSRISDANQFDASVNASDSSNLDVCCVFCRSSASCDGCCSYLAVPISVFASIDLPTPIIPRSCPPDSLHLQRLPADLLRPPITAG
jgi:hypothetical protein